MSSRISVGLRVALAPVFIGLSFIVYSQALKLFEQVITFPGQRSMIYAALLAQGFCAAAVIAVLFCYPLAYVYGRAAVAVAFLATIPVALVRVPELFESTWRPATILMSAYEIAAYTALLVCGTWLAYSRLSRSNYSASGHAEARRSTSR